MIYVTGDTHGDIRKLINLTLNFDDYLIVAGDFGMCWYNDNRDFEKINILTKLLYKILFIDGNHENFKMLNNFPIQEWCGGKIHKISENVYHLMRGYVFEINGLTFWCMGGAKSIDKSMRITDVSWWEEETPSVEEWENAYNNLEKYNWCVDYAITHCISVDIIKQLYPIAWEDEISLKMKDIQNKLTCKEWFIGHYHADKKIGKYRMIYEKLIKLK